MTEKQVADEKLSALMKEHDKDQLELSTANANLSQLALQQETEQIQLAIHRQECEDLRAEIALLNARIKDLLPFERLYKVTKARQHNGSEGMPELITVAASNGPPFGQAHQRVGAAQRVTSWRRPSVTRQRMRFRLRRPAPVQQLPWDFDVHPIGG